MTIRKHAIWFLVLALPLCAGASASTGISDPPLDDQIDGARANAPVLSTSSQSTTSAVEVTIQPATPPAAERALSANPLWAMPLKQFSATRERPIFLPSRRPPAPAPAPVVAVPKIVALPKEPERPQLLLVGTIASDEDKFGIFLDQSTKAVIRLRVGEDFQGWKFQSVQGREVSLEKNQLTVVLALPQPSLTQSATAVRNEAGADNGKLLPANARPRSDR